MLDCISGKVEVEKTFTVERAFFMNKFQEIEEEREKTKLEIAKILKDLDCERSFNQRIFA